MSANLDTLLPAYAPHSGAQARDAWPDGKRLAFCIVPNIEYYEIQPLPNPVRAPWPLPYPDMRNWSWRDYGNRVGVWRCLDVFDKHDVTGSVSLNSAMCDHLPQVVQPFVERGWELFCHGVYNSRYLFGASAEEERRHIDDSSRRIEAYWGQPVRGLLSPALTYNETTLACALDCGLDYVCDISAADEVLDMTVDGRSLVAFPYSAELNDFFAVVTGGLSAHAYVDRFKAQFDQLLAESAHTPKVLGLPLHPYLIGMPQYIWALDEMLGYVRQFDQDVWRAQARHIVDHHRARSATNLERGTES